MISIVDNILKVKDVRKILGCSEYKVYKIFAQPDFPSVKIGREMYIKESDFTRWFNHNIGKEIILY
ncbi:MAG: helix-turn-helix domain-containing protein [Anaerostipes sp.]|uniref:helix-turn-helix domain-containing protein n=1 Tax=Anaerostipes sp. TaxID=1872530 RepID=UPI0039948FAC